MEYLMDSMDSIWINPGKVKTSVDVGDKMVNNVGNTRNARADDRLVDIDVVTYAV